MKREDVVYVADSEELAQACERFNAFSADKISQLRGFLRSSSPEKLDQEHLDNWFRQNGVLDSPMQPLLSHLLKRLKFMIVNRDEKIDYFRRLINETYQRSLVQQYEPLIQVMTKSEMTDETYHRYRMATLEILNKGAWVNGRRVWGKHDESGVGDLSGFTSALKAVGLHDSSVTDFLQIQLGVYQKASCDYVERMLKKIDVRCGQETVATQLEYDRENNTLMIHYVQMFRNLRRVREGAGHLTEEGSPVNSAPIVAESRFSYSFVRDPLNSENYRLKLLSGSFSIQNNNYRCVVVRDLAKHFAKKMIAGEILNVNDSLVIERLIDDCVGISDTKTILNRLIASKNALKIVLVCRMNRAVMREMLKSYELLVCLCADVHHKQYLQLMKCWYAKDSVVGNDISLLLHRIELINDLDFRKCDDLAVVNDYLSDLFGYALERKVPGFSFKQNKIYIAKTQKGVEYSLFSCEGELVTDSVDMEYVDPVDSVLAKPLLQAILKAALREGYIRKNNVLFIVGALHTLSQKKNCYLEYFLSDDAVRSKLKSGWLIDLAMAFEAVSIWMVESGIFLNLRITPDQLCALLRAHPVLWVKLHAQLASSIREIPSRLLSSGHFEMLVLDNRDHHSKKIITSALCQDRILFKSLCKLSQTRPNDLLTYFCRAGSSLRKNWEKEYSECEYKLLSLCEDSVCQKYYHSLFDFLDSQAFGQKFKAIVIRGVYQNFSEKMLVIAKKVLLRILLKRIQRGCDFSSVCDNSEKLDGILRLLEYEPRLAALLKLDTVKQFLVNVNDRQCLLSFVECIVKHHSLPELADTTFQISAISLFSGAELRIFLRSAINSLFMLNLIVKEPHSIEVLLRAGISSNGAEIHHILQQAVPQLLILLLMSILKRERDLINAISFHDKLSSAYGLSETDQLSDPILAVTKAHETELVYLVAIKNIILGSSVYLENLMDLNDCSENDVANLVDLMPDFIHRSLAVDISERHKENLSNINFMARAREENSFGDHKNELGINLEAMKKHFQTLSAENSNGFILEINRFLSASFLNNDLSLGILSTPDLLELFVHHADLRLLARFICLFGKCLEASSQLKFFFQRLAAEPELFKLFGPILLFHYPQAGRLLFWGYAQTVDRIEKCRVINRLLDTSDFDISDFTKLLLREYQESTDQPFRQALLAHTDWLADIIDSTTAENLSELLKCEIKQRVVSNLTEASVIEVSLRKGPVLMTILNLSGQDFVQELLQLDGSLVNTLLSIPYPLAINNPDAIFWQCCKRIATLEQLVIWVTQSDLPPSAVKMCFSLMRGFVSSSQSQARSKIMISAKNLVDLLILACKIDPHKEIQSEWGSLLMNTTLICQHIFNDQTADMLLLKALPVLMNYITGSQSFIETYLENEAGLTLLSYETLSESALEDSVDFLVSKMGMDLIGSDDSSKFRNIVCKLFLTCTENQMKKLSLKVYVSIFIRGFQKYCDDTRMRNEVVIPRLTRALIYLFETDSAFVGSVFADNDQLVDWIKLSPGAHSMLRGSSLCVSSERIMNAFSDCVIDAVSSRSENLPLKEIAGQGSCLDTPKTMRSPSADELIASRRKNGSFSRRLPGSGDSEHSVASSFVTTGASLN